MTKHNFVDILKDPSTINKTHTNNLEALVEKYPYFQSAKALYLKELKNQNSFRYNKNLKFTAASTTDRTVLFDFITSSVFNDLNQSQEESKTIDEITRIDQRVEEQLFIEPDQETPIVDNDDIVETTLESHSEELSDNDLNFELSDDDSIALTKEFEHPVDFNKNDLHTFNEWLQLSTFKPIDRSITFKQPNSLQNKMELIDEFIVKNPKIEPIKQAVSNINIKSIEPDNEDIMTETLARVYVLQHKYSDAINAYEILSLKYPEKSSLFANQIKHIQILKKNYNQNKS